MFRGINRVEITETVNHKQWQCIELGIYLIICILKKKETSDFHGTVSFVQLRCCNKNKNKLFIKRPTSKNGDKLILSSDREELLNLMCTQFFPLSLGS